jgi:hypothetical protein
MIIFLSNKRVHTLGQRSNAAIHKLCRRLEQEPGVSRSSLEYCLDIGDNSASFVLSSLRKSVEFSFDTYALLAATFALENNHKYKIKNHNALKETHEHNKDKKIPYSLSNIREDRLEEH